MLERLLALLTPDTDLAGSTIAGAAAESIVHTRKHRRLIAFHFARALSVGWLLTTFVAPGIAHRFKLEKSEAVAVAFICGYAGVRLLSVSEKAVLSKIKSQNADSEA